MATPNVITYAFIRGRWYAFPDSASAYDGVAKYGGNNKSLRYSKPVGAIIDETTLINTGFWPDTLADAPGVTGDALINPPYNPIFRKVPAEVTTDVTTETVASSGNGGGGGGGGGQEEYGGPDKNVWDFREYVELNPDLANAFRAYKREQDASKIDSWELAGKVGGALGTGPTTSQGMSGSNDPTRNPNLPAGYGGGELNIEQWGNIHWNKYGKNESRNVKGMKNVAGDDPRYEGRWKDYLV